MRLNLIVILFVIFLCELHCQDFVNNSRYSIKRVYPNFYEPFVYVYKDYEFRCEDIVTIGKIEFNVKKFDSVNFKIYLVDSVNYFVGIHNSPMALYNNEVPMFTFWNTTSYSSYSCNWLVGLYNKEDHSIDLQLGYPRTKFKYFFNNVTLVDFTINQCATPKSNPKN